MISWLENLVNWLTDIFDPLITFFRCVISGLISFVRLIPSVLSTISSSITFLPSALLGFVSITVAIFVVYIIVGRDPGD